MNIGFVSTWFERGGAYVTKAYIEAVRSGGHQVYVYARGDGQAGRGNPDWDMPNVTFGYQLWDTNINERHMFRFIKEHALDVVFFNEQMEFDIVARIKREFPGVKLGSYIDYYTEAMLKFFRLFDFLICNTHRHMEAMEGHPQRFYVKWGTDTELFLPAREPEEELVFFHSAGMSLRKGTDALISAFVNGRLYERAKLLVHTQMDITKQCAFTREELSARNVEIIEKTVPAPGLYHMGDVYVYPTRLEGVGLTMYEALSCGMPVIATDFPPMNEIIGEENGRLVKVDRIHARADGYYWPLAETAEESLIEAMEYYAAHKDELPRFRSQARAFAEKELDWKSRFGEICRIFETAEIRPLDEALYAEAVRKRKRGRLKHILMALLTNTRLDALFLKFVQ